MAETKGPFPRLFPRLVPVPKSQIKAASSSIALLPRGVYGFAREFFSPDGGNTIIDISGDMTAFAFVAYWYVAMRWRAQKIAEAPLMVIEEDQDTGEEEWLADHELAEVLETPSLDYDMGELLERTSRYLDNTGEAIWVKDMDRAGRVARLTPFRSGEFTVQSSKDRLFASFKVNTSSGQLDFDAERVCYFRDHCSDSWNGQAKSRLEVAMAWLRLGEKSRQTIRELLDNSVWPSAVIIPDKEWNPDPETLDVYKQDVQNYGLPGNKGRPFIQLGGGTFNQLSAKIADLVPSDVLNRVESVVAAVSGVPAIVLQFQVGMENSPWSQMAQARRMAYDDTIAPSWSRIERVLTRQLLRNVDDDTTHFIRFDRTQIASLQEDRQQLVQTATMMGRAATLNERRTIMGLEPSDDPKADQIPELTDALAQMLNNMPTNDPPNDKPDPPDTEDTPNRQPSANEDPAKRGLQIIERKRRAGAMLLALRHEQRSVWHMTANRLLKQDADAIVEIVRAYLTDTIHKSIDSKARGKDRVMSAVLGYLRDESRPRWSKATTPLLVQGAERSAALTAADLGINFNIMHPNVIKFAQSEAGSLVTGVSETTRKWINDVVTAGLQENRTTNEIAQLLQDSAAFSKERATLIARTETTQAFNGGPHDALVEVSKATGRAFLKTWSGALDDRERDEHLEMEGETVGIDDTFSNGSEYPDEPNCRCVVLYSEVE